MNKFIVVRLSDAGEPDLDIKLINVNSIYRMCIDWSGSSDCVTRHLEIKTNDFMYRYELKDRREVSKLLDTLDRFLSDTTKGLLDITEFIEVD